MSRNASDLLDLLQLRGASHGALIEHLLRVYALNIIAAGVADMRGGC